MPSNFKKKKKGNLEKVGIDTWSYRISNLQENKMGANNIAYTLRT